MMTAINYDYLARCIDHAGLQLGYPLLDVPVGGEVRLGVDAGELAWRSALYRRYPGGMLAIRDHLERTYGVLV